MSLWDYLLPWKSIPNMIHDVKDASKYTGKDKNASIFGAIGKYADPGGALLGDKWMNFWHGTVPEQVNQSLEPLNKFNRKYLDPIAKIVPKDSKLQNVPDFVQAKGGDVAAAISGAILGGGALLGGMGAGSASGGGAAGSGTAAPSSSGGMFNFGQMDWHDPNTYVNLYQQYGGLLNQGQGQQQPQQSPALMAMTDPAEQQRRYLEMLQTYGYHPSGLLG